MPISTIRSAILGKLSAMQTLETAVDYEANQLTGYPAMTLSLKEGTGEFATSAHNRRVRGFTARLYVEREVFDAEKAEDILTAVLGELETALDADVTLSGTCKFAQVASWEAGYTDREVDTRLAEITINAVELMTVR